MLDQFWEVLGYVFALNGEAFRIATTLPAGLSVVLLVVVPAGLSQGVGQGIVLFLNRVRPLRFVLSLVINALLFALGFLALVGSTWLITLLPGTQTISLGDLTTVLGLAYAPLLFACLGAMPYLGLPILNVLSVWHLLAMVVGLSAITDLSLAGAFSYVGLGWGLLQILQSTVGRPLARLSRRVANLAAGVTLVKNPQAIATAAADPVPRPWQQELAQRVGQVRPQPSRSAEEGAGGDRPSEARSSEARSSEARSEATRRQTTRQAPSAVAAPPAVQRPRRGMGQGMKTALGLVGLAGLTGVVLLLLRPLREWWFGWLAALPGTVQLVLNLVWIGLVALVVAGLLAPLETLGWWAGWYDDEVDTTSTSPEQVPPAPAEPSRSRYIVYLDGIGKSTYEYLPDIEEFLDTLAPALPSDIALVRGIMPYSVMNRPLDQDRPLAFLWKYADRLRFANPASLLGLLVNLRNVLIVGVSADQRYGPLYNQGIAQVVFNGLVDAGYPLASTTPVTLIGYSGGGQMSCACAPYLKRALRAPVDVISLGGVISANNDVLQLEHLYHLVGDKDGVERLGPVMFPGRWRLFPLSYWNRARRRGNISVMSMGPVGHQVPGGILDPAVTLADGRSALNQTIDTILAILQGKLLEDNSLEPTVASNYQTFYATPLVQAATYPLHLRPDPQHYRPVGDWVGRLILPDKTQRFEGVYYEVHLAPPAYAHLVGQTVKLCWADRPLTQQIVRALRRDLHFSVEAEYFSRQGGVYPVRLNHWLQVDPLESLAGAHPQDDLIAMVEAPDVIEQAGDTVLALTHQPMEVTGRYYGLVQFIEPVGETGYRVVHYNAAHRAFDGPTEVVDLPPAVAAPDYGSTPSSTVAVHQSPCNEGGWYIYGALNDENRFVVQSWMPRDLVRLQPQRVVFGGAKAGYQYIRREAWTPEAAPKGHAGSVLCSAYDSGQPSAIADAVGQWQVGDQALLLHTYGGIGGDRKEPAAATPIFFGHFAYGRADVVHDPLADELRFDIRYYQVYAHNTDGLIAGTLHWSRYQGDRQLGWLGNRPSCDILVKLGCFTEPYQFDGMLRSPLRRMEAYLQGMTARYRIGDGTGGTFVGPANNCAQDSNQALFASIDSMGQSIDQHEPALQAWAATHPDQSQRLERLAQLGRDLQADLQPFGQPRTDWANRTFNLGSALEDRPLRNLLMGLGSWRTVLPRKASDVVVQTFLEHGASAWVLRTSQVGGEDPQIEPISPMTF